MKNKTKMKPEIKRSQKLSLRLREHEMEAIRTAAAAAKLTIAEFSRTAMARVAKYVIEQHEAAK